MTGRGFGLFYTPILLFLLTTPSSILAQVQPDRAGLGQARFRHPGLSVSKAFRRPNELPPQAAVQAAGDLASLGASANGARLDVRGGRWATLIVAQPLLPGTGAGNNLTWGGLGRAAPGSRGELARGVAQAFREYVLVNGPALRIDSGELAQPGKTTVPADGALVQIHVPREYNGIPVRDSYLHAVINHGNLVLLGANQWGDIDLSTSPDVSHDAARFEISANAL